MYLRALIASSPTLREFKRADLESPSSAFGTKSSNLIGAKLRTGGGGGWGIPEGV